jgi:hypothetical protein
MTEPTKDGGQAFPLNVTPQDLYWGKYVSGMTLRDYFAGQALVGLIMRVPADEQVSASRLTVQAYGISDLMLQERSK